MGSTLKRRLDKLRQAVQEQKREPTVRQSRQVSEQQNALRKHLKTYEEVRSVYMPGLSHHLTTTHQNEDLNNIDSENAKVWLPSEVPRELCSKICVPGLVHVEETLQKARCYDSLKGVHHVLRVKTQMVHFKNNNHESGKARQVINKVVLRLLRCAGRYCKARSAYAKLTGAGPWEKTLQVLRDEDLKSYSDLATVRTGPGRAGTSEEDLEVEDEEYWQELISRREKQGDGVKEAAGSKRARQTQGASLEEVEEETLSLIHPDRTEWDHRSKHRTGETRKGLSWIWTAGGQLDLKDSADENNNNILRSEWCKSQARARRASEEVELLMEEMCRTVGYLEWKQGLKDKFVDIWTRLDASQEDEHLDDEQEEDDGEQDGDEYSGVDDDDGDVEDVGEESNMF
ncbi:hypothetical protein VNI00_018006 [Paramarasmius palmivorus]|uniref:Uncharacterized protein n=1 Tax=Paramarasmius palmivorus TaxID=297713 RepID=A0AAW0B3J3_9AGAR